MLRKGCQTRRRRPIARRRSPRRRDPGERSRVRSLRSSRDALVGVWRARFSASPTAVPGKTGMPRPAPRAKGRGGAYVIGEKSGSAHSASAASSRRARLPLRSRPAAVTRVRLFEPVPLRVNDTRRPPAIASSARRRQADRRTCLSEAFTSIAADSAACQLQHIGQIGTSRRLREARFLFSAQSGVAGPVASASRARSASCNNIRVRPERCDIESRGVPRRWRSKAPRLFSIRRRHEGRVGEGEILHRLHPLRLELAQGRAPCRIG